MLLLILGLVVFLGVHAFTMARAPRAALVGALGEGGYKGLYTLASLAGLVLLVHGYGQYRAHDWVNVWYPPVWTRHLALLLNLPIFVLLAASGSRGYIHATVKHPMLLAVKIWATAHLVANGDLGSMLLFAGFLAWAVAARITLKRRPDAIVPPKPAGLQTRDWLALGIGLALWFAFARWLHPWLIGVAVWPGQG